ncbi:hypothetical protein, partial [Anabaena sp. FACHB-1391]|uniref:hypothetical protein n=1 Tax=Anabaena sp. FACHB-1391 TaxID=2692771 RepID=UPI001A7F09C0
FKVLFFLGSVAVSCFSPRHLFNISILPVIVKGFSKLFFNRVNLISDFGYKLYMVRVRQISK